MDATFVATVVQIAKRLIEQADEVEASVGEAPTAQEGLNGLIDELEALVTTASPAQTGSTQPQAR